MADGSGGFNEAATAGKHRRPIFCVNVSESVEASYCAPWLQIPSLFVEHYLQEYLPKAETMKATNREVMLEGPSRKVWPVSICGMKVTSMGFKTGWWKFSADLQLAKGDVLVIKLMSKSHFKVKTFGKDGLEKVLLLKKDKEGKRKRTDDGEVDHFRCPTKQQKRCNSDSRGCRNGEVEVQQEWDSRKSIVSCVKGDTPADTDSLQTVIDEFMVLDEEPRTAVRNLFPLTYLEKAEDTNLYKEANPLDVSTIVSRRRPVSQAEKERALNAARQFKTSLPAFRKIMKKSNVYRGFWLGISRGFAAEYLPCETQQVVLMISSGKQWVTKLLGSRSNPGLSGGWRKFAVDNYLEEGDVCVFEVTDRADLHVMVHIYRVVELDEMQKQDKAHLPKKCHMVGMGKMRGVVSVDEEKKNSIKARTNNLPTSVCDLQLVPGNRSSENGELCGIEVEIFQHLKSMLMQKKLKEDEPMQQPNAEHPVVKAEPLDWAEICPDMQKEVQHHLAEHKHDDLDKSKHKEQPRIGASNVKMRGRIRVKTDCLDNTQALVVTKKSLCDVNGGSIQAQSESPSSMEPEAYSYYHVERLTNRRKGKCEDEFLVQLSSKAESEVPKSRCSKEEGGWWVPLSYFKAGFDSCHL